MLETLLDVGLALFALLVVMALLGGTAVIGLAIWQLLLRMWRGEP